MPTKVTIHPTARIAFIVVAIASIAGGGLVGMKRLLRPSHTSEPVIVGSEHHANDVDALPGYLLPVIRVPVVPNAHESEWSEALAAVLGGRTEVVTDHGRVDVLTERFAIEVDRIAKWHESIGQAIHYSKTTKKRAAVALILLPSDSVDKVELIESVCDSKGIKLLILQTTRAR